MIDSWFKYDLTNIYGQHTAAVFIDESGDAQFLLKTIEGEYTIHQANSELEELHVKYLIEKAQPSNERFLFIPVQKRMSSNLSGNIARPADAWRSVTFKTTSRTRSTRP